MKNKRFANLFDSQLFALKKALAVQCKKGSRASIHQRGFSLIEALCAGIILGLCSVTLSGLIIQSMHATNVSEEYQTAAELLNQVLTKVDVVGPSSLIVDGPTEGTFDSPHENYSWSIDIENDEETNDLYTIEAVISWSTITGNRQVTGSTLLYDPANSRGSISWEDL